MESERPALAPVWFCGALRQKGAHVIEDLWYKNAIIYCLDVERYLDANGDGIGDFAGLNQKLDYLAGLGVNAYERLPTMPSCARCVPVRMR